MFLTSSSFKKVIQPVVSWKRKIFTGIMNTSIEIKYNFFKYLKKLQLLWKKMSIIKTWVYTIPCAHCAEKKIVLWEKGVQNMGQTNRKLGSKHFSKKDVLTIQNAKKSLQSSWNRNETVELIRGILDLLLHFRKTCYSFNHLWFCANIVYYLTRI